MTYGTQHCRHVTALVTGDVPASGTNGTSTPPAATAAGKTLLATAVSQPTVNPTWAVSEISWLLADVRAEDLEGTRCESNAGINQASIKQSLNRFDVSIIYMVK